jgi:hypothetical protein
MNDKTYLGSCLCGKVRYEIRTTIQNIVYCHCSQCRKAQGSAFATNGDVELNGFYFISGENKLTGYESTPGETKYFCRYCGSPIISKSTSNPGKVRVRLGTIESDIMEKPFAHIFVSSKANWDDISDTLPQYESYEPNRDT